MRVVLDANVLVRASTHPAGAASRLLDRLIELNHAILTSKYVLGELDRVLRYPRIAKLLRKSERSVERIVSDLSSAMLVVDVAPSPTGVACRDPKDDDVIRLVEQTGADVLCTRDEDLRTPEVVEYFRSRGTRVLTDLELLTELFQ